MCGDGGMVGMVLDVGSVVLRGDGGRGYAGNTPNTIPITSTTMREHGGGGMVFRNGLRYLGVCHLGM